MNRRGSKRQAGGAISGVAVLAAALLQLPAPVQAGTAAGTQGFPLAIVCSKQDGAGLAYLSWVSTEGTATYAGLTGTRAGTISLEGPFERVGTSGVEIGEGCAGKTLAQLREQDLVIEMP